MKSKRIFTLLLIIAALLALGIGGVFAFANEEPQAESKGKINVWLIAGQSNAVGYGYGAPEGATVDPRYVDGFENVIYYGSRSGAVTSDFLPTTVGMGKGSAYCGPEIGIASALGNSDEPHAVIKYAVGGTSLYPITTSKTWTSDSYIADVNGDDDPNNDVDTSITTIGGLYDNFMNTVKDGLKLLTEDGYTPVIKGLLWSQGGAESGNTARASEYAKLLYHVVNDMRQDLSIIANDPALNDSENPLPFVIVKTYRNPDYETEATLKNVPIINEAQRTVASQLPGISIIDPSGVYKFSQLDSWHYSTEGQLGTGELFISEVMAKESKYLVTSDGEYAIVDIGYHTTGDTVTANFTINENYDITSLTMQIGKGEKVPVTLFADNTYTFTMPSDTVTFEIETLAKGAMDIVTPYGTIPKKYFVAENYPIAIFKNGEFVDVAATFNADADKKIAAAGDGATLLLRCDYDMSGDPGGGNYLSQLNGSAIYDLGGYTVKMGENSTADAFLKGDAYALGYHTQVTVKNGCILMGEDPIIRFSAAKSRISSEYVAGATENPQQHTFTLDRIKIGLDERVTDYGKNFLFSNQDLDEINQNVTKSAIVVNECDFDLSGVPDGFNIFRKNNINATTELVGGKLTVDSLDGITVNKGTNLTVKKGADGEYTIVCSKTMFTTSESFTSDVGTQLGFSMASTTNDGFIYKLTNVAQSTPYGDIPDEYASTTDYPWLIFKNNECLGGGTDFAKAVFASAATAGDGTVIYLRCNVDDSAFVSPKNAQSTFNGTITVDLGGHTVTMTTKALLRSQVVASGYDTNVILKNGKVVVGEQPIARFAVTTDAPATYAEDSKTAPHKFTVTLENLYVTRNTTVTTPTKRICSYSGSNYGSTVKFDNNLIAKNCTFDFAEAADFAIFSSNSAMGVKLQIIGGVIKAPAVTNTDGGIRITSLGGGSVRVDRNSDGEYMKLILPSYVDAPASNYIDARDTSVKDLRFYMTKRGETENEFTLIRPSSFNLNTPYGTISEDYASAVQYPFALFVPDTENGGMKFVEAFTDYAYDKYDIATGYPLSVLYRAYKSYKSGAVVYLRRDFDYNAAKAFSMIGSISDIVIDLGGHTITDNSTHSYGLLYVSKKQATDTTITLKNGTVVLYDRPLSSLYTNAKATADTSVNLVLENLRLECAKDATLTDVLIYDNTVSAPLTAINVNMTLNSCTFDLSNLATVNATLFNANICKNKTTAIKCKTIITVNGGEIIANNALKLTEIHIDNGSNVIFTKSKSGNYTSVTVTKALKFLNDTVNTTDGKTLGFAKISEDEATSTYRLRPAEFTQIDCSPKMSITLASELVVNIYIPVNYTQKFTFNGTLYENLEAISDKKVTADGQEYYHLTVALGSAEAAKDIILEATVSKNDVTATASYTFSIFKYAAKVLKSGTDIEKTLVKDVLLYVKAAYNYFTALNTAEEIERVTTLVDSIVGDYKAAPVSSGVTKTKAPVTSVTLNLDAKPTIRFYVTDTNVDFFANDVKLNTVTGTDATYGAYVELDVYAYALSETITYGDGGSYHISDFINGADGTSHEILVKAFVKYVESAADYRKSVIAADN